MGLEKIKTRLTKVTKLVDEYLTHIITLCCAVFVFLQGCKCVMKYDSFPTSTDVSIKKAETYPEVTICPLSTKLYNEYLQKCNLTDFDYFEDLKWVGNGSCQDPKILWDTMVRSKDLIVFFSIQTNDDSIYINVNDADNLRSIDTNFGRCYTLMWPQNLDPKTLIVGFKRKVVVVIHPPGEFFGSESPRFKLYPGTTTTIDIHI